MSRSTSQSSATTTTTATGLSRSLSVKTNAKSSPNINPLPPSDVKLFVTNLRLLDLDLRDDWPGITVQTFSSKNADQKQRIGGVEWALFRLFEIWNPEETSQKLQPFFPPLEPLQSLNLRAALYRCLNELKKNGVLGRESVLRKTMLDECKGEKFYEILVPFSTAVLRKVLASRKENRKRMAVVRELATASMLSNNRQSSLIPLAIAHKAALVNVLKRKDEKRRRYREFEDLMAAKVDEINQRNKQCKATPRSRKPSVPQNDAAAIKKQLKDNWIGNQQWLDTMLHGDDVQVEDAFLSRSFPEVWRMVEKGRRLQDATPDVGVLENLQARIEEQQTRLQKWKSFHDKMLKDRPTSSSQRPSESKGQASAGNFKFDDHLNLQLRSSKSKEDETTIQKEALHPEYQTIIADMEVELLHVSKAKHNRSTAPPMRRRGSSFSNPRSPARRKKSRSDTAPKKPIHYPASEKPAKPAPSSREQSKETMPPPPLMREPTSTPTDSDTTLIGHRSTSVRAIPTPPEAPEYAIEDDEDAIHETSNLLPTVSSPPHPIPERVQPRSPSPPPSSYFPSEPPVLEAPALSHEEELAEQIISSIGEATPSPVKKQPRPPLMERARISMAHASGFQPIEESPPDANPLPELPAAKPAAPLDRRTSLLERTRLSMASMAANPRPQPKKEKRKSTRQSLYPVNQFETPKSRKSFQALEAKHSGEKTPKEELFSDDVDYERVFKSRPKIAQSPILSPAVGEETAGGDEGEGDTYGAASGLGIGEYDEGVTGVDLDDVDADEDAEGFTQAWESSPLRRAGGGKGKGRVLG
ncbi:hypothetical protein K469DRAFT_660335 [Zopfia rhizophila CBS 207.26]|uniref:HAUS augmin-like complex subunit 6 N-terminal domain-containing protein n=1 Tax=Zopfia rhizophila CBS 207.26 TaxID=1314779 RepID=A0A6A6E9X7_9PEZI|nr:hypothetical protein K469DRAFT_660335 [Zopfia rhizophila CBS 207.26]